MVPFVSLVPQKIGSGNRDTRGQPRDQRGVHGSAGVVYSPIVPEECIRDKRSEPDTAMPVGSPSPVMSEALIVPPDRVFANRAGCLVHNIDDYATARGFGHGQEGGRGCKKTGETESKFFI